MSVTFTIPEIISLIGVIQCVYIFVATCFRAGKLSRAGLSLLFFSVLGGAFFFDLGESRLESVLPHYKIYQWFFWFMLPPVSVLLVLQIIQIKRVPALTNFVVLLFVPAMCVTTLFFSKVFDACVNGYSCELITDALHVSGLVAGAMSLLALWFNRSIFDDFSMDKINPQRYWLIMSLIVMNIVFLALTLVFVTDYMSFNDFMLSRNVIGLVFIYLVITSLFRIYPHAVRLEKEEKTSKAVYELNDSEQVIAGKIRDLMFLDKVYQEPSYSRAELARELDISEAVLSKIINVSFEKSFPQLLNEHRVEDAKRLLTETDAPIHIVAEEAGFNSLPSFNRVFKEICGVSAGRYRKNT